MELVVIVALVLLNGVFSGAEIALLSVRKTRLGELASDGRRGAAAALKLRQEPERLLATVQVAITLLGAAAAAFGGVRLEGPLAAQLTLWGVPGKYADHISFVVVVSTISYFSLVFGELVPKSIALRKAETFTLVVARALDLLSRVVKPAVWLLTQSSNLVLRPMKDRTNFSESRLSAEELQQLVEEASVAGSLPPAAGEIASRAIDLAALRVKDIMIPRGRVVGMPVVATRDDLHEILLKKPHSRYPVYDRNIDDVLGYLMARELYEALLEPGSLDVRALVRPVLFLPETTEAMSAMRKMQEARQRFALVVDETGGVVGGVTLADVAEELMGEVLDEDKKQPEQLIVPDENDTYLVRGDAPIHEVERVLDTSLEEEGSRAATVAGLLIEKLGKIPLAGERTRLGEELDVEVVDASERRVKMLRVRRLPREHEEAASPPG